MKYFSLLTGSGVTVLVASLLVFFIKYYRSVEKFGLSRLAHDQEIACSNHVTATLFCHGRNKYRKKENIIVLITKKECFELQKLGHHFGSEGTLHHTYSRKRKYYLTESRKAMTDLEMIRKSHIIEK